MKSQLRPSDCLWEQAHSSIAAAEAGRGEGIRHVGGGQSVEEARALYYLRKIAMVRVLRRLAFPAHPRVFEFGSGCGFWTDFFARRGVREYVGSDVSHTAVERLSRSFPQYKFWSMEDAAAGWASVHTCAPYDLGLAIDVLYHVVNDASWELSLSELCAVTGRHVLVVDYFYEQPREPSSHVKHRPVQMYIDVLSRQGFRVVFIQPIFWLHNRLIGGPWADQNRLSSKLLRTACSLGASAWGLAAVDVIITKLIRPMHPQCKSRMLVATRS